jgi:allophanate hydrolase
MTANSAPADPILLAVVGAHLSGMPLNGELQALGASFVKATRTASAYRLYQLEGTVPPKPGLLRVLSGGMPIEVEVWALSPAAFGLFVSRIPAPLGIGTLHLADGEAVKGFLVESCAVGGARDVSEFGAWRAFMASLTPAKAAAG